MTEHKGGSDMLATERLNIRFRNKEIEETVLRLFDTLRNMPEIDQRCLAIGRTQVEMGFAMVDKAIVNAPRMTTPIPEPDDPMRGVIDTTQSAPPSGVVGG